MLTISINNECCGAAGELRRVSFIAASTFSLTMICADLHQLGASCLPLASPGAISRPTGKPGFITPYAGGLLYAWAASSHRNLIRSSSAETVNGFVNRGLLRKVSGSAQSP
jgi:hypothetical protein